MQACGAWGEVPTVSEAELNHSKLLTDLKQMPVLESGCVGSQVYNEIPWIRFYVEHSVYYRTVLKCAHVILKGNSNDSDSVEYRPTKEFSGGVGVGEGNVIVDFG